VKLSYREGDTFAVPLKSGGFAVAVVARISPGGRVLLGYFFGPRLKTSPAGPLVPQLRNGDAILVARFGDLGIIRGEWTPLGQVPGFTRNAWPMPVFHRQVLLGGPPVRVQYRDDDPNSVPRESPISENEAKLLPEDGLLGSVAVERVLDSLLAQKVEFDA